MCEIFTSEKQIILSVRKFKPVCFVTCALACSVLKQVLKKLFVTFVKTLYFRKERSNFPIAYVPCQVSPLCS